MRKWGFKPNGINLRGFKQSTTSVREGRRKRETSGTSEEKKGECVGWNKKNGWMAVERV